MDGKMIKYYSLKKSILEKIESGVYAEGMMIESEREMMEKYQFSRITVRKAIDELVNEGYLYRVQGKGTFVKGDVGNQNLFELNSCTEDVLRLGRIPSKKTIVSEVIPADEKRARRLNIMVNDPVLKIGRVTYADGEPLNYTDAYLPLKLFPGLEKVNLEEHSLYEVLRKDYSLVITKSRRTLEAVLPEARIASLLGISVNMPVILFYCTTSGILHGKEIPFETFKCYYRTDHYKFYIDQANT